MKKFIAIFSIAILSLLIAYAGFANETADSREENSNFPSTQVCPLPIEVTLDYAKPKGKFNRYLFSAFEPVPFNAESYRSIKQSDFKAVAIKVEDFNEDRAKALAENNLEGLIFYSVNRYLEKEEVENGVQALLDKIDSFKVKYPNLEIGAFIFANEPDLPVSPDGGSWKATREELFKDYGYFAKYLKSKRLGCFVGGLGFASAVSLDGMAWIKAFIEYVDDNRIPLDFVAFHGLGFDVKNTFSGAMDFVARQIKGHPVLSMVYPDAKIALTKLGIEASPVSEGKEYPPVHTAWETAHDIMAMIALTDKGLWMAIKDYPFANQLKDLNYSSCRAFNSLADTVQIAQEGSNFETFGVLAGKSEKDDSLVIVISHYDENALLSSAASTLGEGMTVSLPDEIHMQSKQAQVYKVFSLSVCNIPWDKEDFFIFERYLLDDSHNLKLVEKVGIRGNPKLEISREIGLPQVQLLKIYKR